MKMHFLLKQMSLFILLLLLTLNITIWDSSKISRKLGFSTDRLMLGTARTHNTQHVSCCLTSRSANTK